MTSIQVFDHIQRKDAEEQASAMRGSDQPMQECIQFGNRWRDYGLSVARRAYEQARKRREQEQSVEAKRARLLRELEELEDLGESA